MQTVDVQRALTLLLVGVLSVASCDSSRHSTSKVTVATEQTIGSVPATTSDPSADRIVAEAVKGWSVCCPSHPQPEDLAQLLRAALVSLIKPDFDTYHTEMSSRGCFLNSYLDAECEDFREKNVDFGYSDAEWGKLDQRQRASAYWKAVDSRGARWLKVDVKKVKSGAAYNSIPQQSAGRLVSFGAYRAPGGPGFQQDCVRDAVPVAFVQIPVGVRGGEINVTLCFGFDSTAAKWYPFCAIVDCLDYGPKCVLRI